MNKSRRTFGRRLAFLCLGVLSGAGIGYVTCLTAGIIFTVGSIIFGMDEMALGKVDSFSAFLFALMMIVFVSFAACVPGAAIGFLSALAFPFCARRELSAAIGASVGVLFLLPLNGEAPIDNSLILWLVLLVLAFAGAFAGWIQNAILHRLESDD